MRIKLLIDEVMKGIWSPPEIGDGGGKKAGGEVAGDGERVVEAVGSRLVIRSCSERVEPDEGRKDFVEGPKLKSDGIGRFLEAVSRPVVVVVSSGGVDGSADDGRS